MADLLNPKNILGKVTGSIFRSSGSSPPGLSSLPDLAQKVTGGLLKKTGSSIMEDMFGVQGATLVEYLSTVFDPSKPSGAVLTYFYEQLYRDFAPDINGYTLIFFVPPYLSGYGQKYEASQYNIESKESFMSTTSKMMTFAAVDFTPPQSQIKTENVSTRSGAIPIASEVAETDTCSITFVESDKLEIYLFHHLWMEYIREILEGRLEPESGFYDPESDYFGAIDYAASFYIVKYRPDVQTITFAAKCVGVFPQTLPNKELIGNRTTNEITTLPFTYSCAGYRGALGSETNHWILKELDKIIQTFKGKSSDGMFGGFLGGVLNSVIGPTSGAIANLTGNAATLGGMVGNVAKFGQSAVSKVSAISNGDFKSVFTINKSE